MSTSLVDDHHSNHKFNLSPNRSWTAEKEAVFVEPQTPVKTTVKSAACGTAPSDTPKTMGPLTTPTKGADVAEPWTPTSNLKMLISAASPEIRNREKERSAENTETEELESFPQESEPAEETEKLSRKEKSLGLLCQKFLARYPNYPNPAVNNDICLDDVAAELNVERRRIYDIMNVLESLNMVSRLAKNRYTWHGRVRLAQTLAALGRAGETSQYGQQMQQLRQRSLEREFDLDGEEKENEEVDVEGGQKEMSFTEAAADSKGSRKDKSLRVMSQKFVMLFLVSSPRVVSLEIAAKILIGEDQVVDQDKSKFKTKIRRLYDIANVLSSLELIKKVHVTEERGRKPAFKWTGPEDLPSPQDMEATMTAASLASRPLESRSSLDNCTKNLFSSPSPKRGFTRHHSLVKLARSIQDDRRKISSAPSSPLKMTSEAGCAAFHSSKMERLAAICKMQLDQQTLGVHGHSDVEDSAAGQDESAATSPGAAEMRATPREMQFPVLPAGAIPYLPSHQGSSLIPVLLPQPQVGGSYAVYVHHASLRPHPSARPPPTSMAVRSMTFESPGGANPKHAVVQGARGSSQGRDPASPHLKRAHADVEEKLESSPRKITRTQEGSKSASPKLGEIFQARLKARSVTISSRPSPRALHLDPEFSKPPESRAPTSLEHSVETFLEKEERVPAETLTFLQPAHPHTPKSSTPVQEAALPIGHIHAETLFPTGYLIPIPQQPLLAFKETLSSSGEASKVTTPTYIYHTPTAGSRPPPPQEFTPTSLSLPRGTPLSPFLPHGHRLHSPSPAILNFTLQNLGLIPSASTPTSTPTEQASSTAVSHPGMIFVKPISPAGALQGQPLTLISMPQPLLTTPKGGPALQHSFFHTPVSALPIMTTPTAPQRNFPQRKLEVSPEDT